MRMFQSVFFVVKTAYHSISNSGLWSKLWKLKKTIPKHVHFAWRILHNSLAVKKELIQRGVSVSSCCTRCNATEEDIDHVFSGCIWARQAWFCSPLGVRFDNHDTSFILGLENIILQAPTVIIMSSPYVMILGMQDIVAEGDSRNVIHALKASSIDNSYFGMLISDCSGIHDIQASHVKRVANNAAYTLAKFDLSNVDSVWIEECPPYISSIIAGRL